MPLLTINSSIIDSLKTNEIFPDVLDSFDPKGLLTISYGNSNEVALGNTLKVADTQTKPTFQLTLNSGLDTAGTESVNETDLFTLVMTDPDAPSRTDKKWSEYAHYITTNIKLTSLTPDSEFISSTPLTEAGDEILPYHPPGPPLNTGKHRYVFVLYKQPNGHTNFVAPSDRPNWGYGQPAVGVRKWANSYGLVPFAVNFFQAENADNQKAKAD
ncbi:hypothetical protein WICPIJ_001828 [Wickerhamomyces pijperi]|uniref:Carboxypeptidase Y inhibitor n=1 Tax=Wickerhamomyces pijperi TaxID=599730 RepID=A0A9P8TPI4_WICPI|nr:hypothetical protein WICPIJ_001828 [Wickerhamomyces pijperi]